MPHAAGPARAVSSVPHWLGWLLGAASLAAVIAVALHLSEARSFAQQVARMEPGWLLLALLLQVLTYLSQGQLYRTVARSGQTKLSLWHGARLGLIKLFIDQALPSYGLSGTLAATAAFERHGISRQVVMACLAVSVTAYLLAYVASLAAALAVAVVQGHAAGLMLLAGALFVLGALGLGLAVALLAGHPLPAQLGRLPGGKWLLQRPLAVLEQADPRLVRSRRLLLTATALDLGIVLLDASTLWVLILALGGSPSWASVFAGYMLASVLRTIGVTPGGLGVFEAALITTLSWAGIALPVALSATLLFRGLSFWLPMLPGLLLARSAMKYTAALPAASGEPWWSWSTEQALRELDSTPDGLDAARLARHPAATALTRGHSAGLGRIFMTQLHSPLMLILVVACMVSLIVAEWLDALIVLAIILLSTLLTALQERRASRALEKLRTQVALTAQVHRDGQSQEVPAARVLPGDVVELAAGGLVPADGLLLEARDCFVAQGLLTGESTPVQKIPGVAAVDASLAERNNCLFMGSSIRSGTARLLVVRTGAATEYGHIAQSLTLRPPETEFERGLRHFGTLLLRLMVAIVLAVLAANVLLDRPTVDTLLFAIALAVGLSPEMLPAVLGITLAQGAQRMARRGVIVRHLNAIENLGAMDVLCCDKTGTLTRGVARLDQTLDAQGQPSPRCLFLAALNASLQTGMANPLDEAISAAAQEREIRLDGYRKLDENPYDFVRKRLGVLVADPAGAPLLIVKGALDKVLDACTRLDPAQRVQLDARFGEWSAQGYRVLGIATRAMPGAQRCTVDDERNLEFEGFLLIFDPPEPGVADTLKRLEGLGVRVKVISGDNHRVTRHVADAVGLDADQLITGGELLRMKDDELLHRVQQVTLFAEVDPGQKERIILALQKTGHVVGFLGDGINDAPALYAADVGISVDQAADVAREAADFVLLRHDLDLLRLGIDEGRHTFANTLKYIFITTSANFGNMISMALASLLLPFLPLLAKQILLNNFLSDLPAMTLSSDNVDREWERTPHRWDLREVRNAMLFFGLTSSLFDALTFGLLFYVAGDHPALFRSGWFLESVLTELAIIFVVRTYKPFYSSRPGRWLLASTLAVMLLTLLLPYTPVGSWFDLAPLPWPLLAAILVIALLYAATSEWVKLHLLASARRATHTARRHRGRPLRPH